jgi:hypothetical protein
VAKTANVNAEELRSAFEFVSAGEPFEHSAYICLDTGKIYFQSDMIDMEEEALPEDLEISDRYIEVPHKRELHLGRRLALTFVDQELPDDSDTVARFFQQRGAHSRFKDLLEQRAMLERWYDFENRAIDTALRDWCEENGIQPVDE